MPAASQQSAFCAAPDLPDDVRERLRRFEDVWRRNERPNIGDFLYRAAPYRRILLVALIHRDLAYRLSAGQCARVETYLECFPELLLEPADLLGLIGVEYQLRRGKEPGLSSREYQKRFPQYGKDLLCILDNQECTRRQASATPPPTRREESRPKKLDQNASVPELVGRYHIKKVLGEGGFGVVHLAQDEPLSRLVAVKVPHAGIVADPEIAAAYLTEARAAASLDHPNIVPVSDIFSTANHPFIIVSKFMDGGSLKDRNAPLSLEKCAGLVATVAEALHHAHQQGRVHRGIKPENILFDAAARPFLADFGLAVREPDIGKMPAGTAVYLSPEQARGESHRVDARGDVFSLGVVFYELLTGSRLFPARSRAEFLEQSALELRPPRQWDNAIPEELERVCLRMLARRAADRPTAREVGDDLRHWLSTRQKLPDPGPSPQPARTAAASREAQPGAAASVDRAVFLSHASEDQATANQLCQLLEARGIGCWIAPRDVPLGLNYARAIIDAIDATPTTILLLSAHANASVHVTHEIERATSKCKRVIPVRLENIQPGPSLELHLGSPQWLDAWRYSVVQVADQLARTLRDAGERLVAPSPAGRLIDKIVPKGLRAFDAHDADFFLELLPDPRDREGLPDSIRYWKVRIEETDPESTFAVGLIYGPSGSGKSSLMKAGLLPRLGGHVLPVYLEAAAEQTEARLLGKLRKRCPAAPDDLNLKETLAALRRGQGLPRGKKLLIVLDQFEQWLHARCLNHNTELAEALRQCDGGRVQCILMVRDDFWLAISRFMGDIEVGIVQNSNVALVDLFALDHARKVLTAFGQALGRLPEPPNQMGKEEHDFLNQALTGLAEGNKVICIRLALFAEMMKGKPWVPATLKEVGGTEGVGVTFLEETFAAATANPRHRQHQKAVREVLKTLLPDAGTDIKGHWRSEAELLAASGYSSRPKHFAELLSILNNELRLVTPTDPEGKEEGGGTKDEKDEQLIPIPNLYPSSVRYYQLTHDYLVPDLREWLTRKQKQTRRGRAELLLADLTRAWEASRDNRQLPSLGQWLRICCLTRMWHWAPAERRMMRKAGRRHTLRSVALAILFITVAVTGLIIHAQSKAAQAAAVNTLVLADRSHVAQVLQEIKPQTPWLAPQLKKLNEQAKYGSPEKLRTSLALLTVDPSQQDYLFEQMLQASPEDLELIRDALLAHRGVLVGPLWATLQTGHEEPGKRFRAACALAAYDPSSEQWQAVSGLVAEQLVAAIQRNPGQYAALRQVLTPIRQRLRKPLHDYYRSQPPPESSRKAWALTALVDFFAEDAVLIADVLDADEAEFRILFPKIQACGPSGLASIQAELDRQPSSAAGRHAQQQAAKRRANWAITLLRLTHDDSFLQQLRPGKDNTVRSYLVHRLAPYGIDSATIVALLKQEKDVSVRRALVLALGGFDADQLSRDEQQALIVMLLGWYRDDTDGGLHAAAGWLLRRWGMQKELVALDQEWAGNPSKRDADVKYFLTVSRGSDRSSWYVDGQAQTMVIVPVSSAFLMGSPSGEPGRERIEQQHWKQLGHSFAIAANEVTVAQFLRFLPKYYNAGDEKPPGDCSVGGVTWYQAARYCNCLSEQEGLPRDQWCYLPNSDGEYEQGMTVPADYLQRRGYRLPTEAEWEYACRAGTLTSRHFGESDELLQEYAWYNKTSQFKAHPGGLLMPNDLGLFDMLGNVDEWCHERSRLYTSDQNSKRAIRLMTFGRSIAAVGGLGARGMAPVPGVALVYLHEMTEDIGISDSHVRVVRGGSFTDAPATLRSAQRLRVYPTSRNPNVGFRVARTIVAN